MDFTGKEADEEVGLVYFGQRYLMPRIARWSTPDPLQIHALGGGEPFNSYHYVSGNLLQATDPIGLENPAPASSASVDAQSTPGTERALGEAVRVSTLPTSSDGRPLAQLHDGDFFMGGPGPDMNRAAPVDRAAWVQYAHAHHLPIFVFLPGSDAPTFEQAVAQRQETTSGRAIAVLSLLTGAIPSPSGVNGGVPFGVGHHSAPTAIGLLLALGAAALNVFGAVIARAAQGANAARGAAAANAARGAEAAAGGERAAQAGLSRLGSSVQRALDRLRGASAARPTEEAARGAEGLAARFDPSRAGHIFREAAGHVNPASAASQGRFARLFEQVASNPANLRADAVQAGLLTQQAAEAGVQAFTWTGRTGQVWVTIRNGVVQNAGVNPLGAFR